MSTIRWASGVSGTWSTAADWVGGVVPGAADNAAINAAGTYDVTIDAPVSVASVTLNASGATISDASMLAFNHFHLDAGTLLLSGSGTLSGIVSQAEGATFALAAQSSGDLDNVTWNGLLDPTGFLGKAGHPQAHLTISNGITLHGASGSGPGQAIFEAVTLNAVSQLDNATISITGTSGGMIVTNTPTLTLEANLVLTGDIYDSTGTVINDGSLTAGQAAAHGDFVNNGTVTVQDLTTNDIYRVNGPAVFGGKSFTNNGAITVTAGAYLALDLAHVHAAGTHAAISLQGGTVELVGSLTTAAMLAFDAAQSISGTAVSGMAYGFGVAGTLNNSGATLDLGPTTTLGEYRLAAAPKGATTSGTITGGTIIDEAGGGTIAGPTYASVLLQNLALQSDNATLTLNSVDLSNDTVSGPVSVIMGGSSETLTNTSFNGVSTLDVGYTAATLDGVTFTGVSSSPTITSGDYLSLAARQSIAGLTIDAGGTLILAANALYNSGTINVSGTVHVSGQGTTTFGPATLINGGFSTTFAPPGGNADDANPASQATVLNQGTITCDGFAGGSILFRGVNFNNAGALLSDPQYYEYATVTTNLTNSGTISIGSLEVDGALSNSGSISVRTLIFSPTMLTNSGSISVNNGFAILQGGLTDAQYGTFLNAVTLANSYAWLEGNLNLSGQTVDAADLGPLVLGGGSITNGTLTVDAGTDFNPAHPSSGLLSDGKLSAALINNGTVQGNLVTFSAVSGEGTITFSPTINNQVTSAVFNSTVSAGQTVDLPSSIVITLEFGSAGAASGFAGTLAGFQPGDSLAFAGNTLTAGSFSGDSIQVTLSTGTTLSLATSAALTGSLIVTGSGLLTYAGAAPGLQDWSWGAEPATAQDSAEPLHSGGAMPDAASLDWIMAHHGLHGFGV